MNDTTQQDDFPLGFSAVSPEFINPNSVNVLSSDRFLSPWHRSPARPSPASASTLPNSVYSTNSWYSTTDLRSRSPIVQNYYQYLWEPRCVHIETNLEKSRKTILYHQFNGIISRRNWYLPMVRRIASNVIPNLPQTTIQILSGR